MLKSMLKWAPRRADPMNGFIRQVLSDPNQWGFMTRRARRYRTLTWVCCGAMLCTGALASMVWGTGQTALLTAAQAGMILSTVGAVFCAIMMRRGVRSSKGVDFGVGIADYRLTEFDRYHRSA